MPFAPRPPGPSGGRLAFDPARRRRRPRHPSRGPQEFTLEYDFDMAVMGRHAGVLTQIYNYARKSRRGTSRSPGVAARRFCPNGTTITERAELAELRAREVAKLLAGAGIDAAALEVAWSSALERPDGDGDWHTPPHDGTSEP